MTVEAKIKTILGEQTVQLLALMDELEKVKSELEELKKTDQTSEKDEE